jgi:hypothetical protein
MYWSTYASLFLCIGVIVVILSATNAAGAQAPHTIPLLRFVAKRLSKKKRVAIAAFVGLHRSNGIPKRTTTMKERPKPKVPPPTSGLTSLEAISIRDGPISKKKSTETWDTTNKNTQASRGRASKLIRFQ